MTDYTRHKMATTSVTVSASVFVPTDLLGKRLSTISGFIDQEECDKLIKRGDERGWQKSSVSGGGHGRKGCENPVTNSFSVLADQTVADDFWSKLKKIVPDNASFLGNNTYFDSTTKGTEWTKYGIYPHLRLYKYDKNDVFPEHDDYKIRKKIVDEDGTQTIYMSFLTLLVYLNDDFSGGQTCYWPDRKGVHCRFKSGDDKASGKKEPQIRIKPISGMAVIQDQNIMHEALAPGNGTKYILRTDILYKRVIKPNPKLPPPGKRTEGSYEKVFEASCKNYAL